MDSEENHIEPGDKVSKQFQTGRRRLNLNFDSVIIGLFKKPKKSIDYTGWHISNVDILQFGPSIKIISR